MFSWIFLFFARLSRSIGDDIKENNLHSFIRSSVHPFIRSFVHPFTRSPPLVLPTPTFLCFLLF